MPWNSCSAPIGSSNGATWLPNEDTSWSRSILEVGALAVELVHEDARAGGSLGRQLPRVLRLDLDAVDRGDDDDHGVGGANRGADVADEVRRARRVEDVDLGVLPLDRRHRQRDRDRRRCSSGSWSETVLPSSTVPIRVRAPEVKSIASRRSSSRNPRGRPARRCGCPSRRRSSTRLLDARADRGEILQSCYARPTCDAELAEVRTTAARHRDHPFGPAGRWRALGGAGGSSWRASRDAAAWAAGASGALLLLGGHRANHGAGGPTDRMLDDLLDRLWDGGIPRRSRGWRATGTPRSRSRPSPRQPVVHRRLHPRARRGARLLRGGAARDPGRPVRPGRRVPVLRMDVDRVGRRRDVGPGRRGPRPVRSRRRSGGVNPERAVRRDRRTSSTGR